eukprot:Trichotokara_eunicae@DN6395_c0_g1_i1.p1
MEYKFSWTGEFDGEADNVSLREFESFDTQKVASLCYAGEPEMFEVLASVLNEDISKYILSEFLRTNVFIINWFHRFVLPIWFGRARDFYDLTCERYLNDGKVIRFMFRGDEAVSAHDSDSDYR